MLVLSPALWLFGGVGGMGGGDVHCWCFALGHLQVWPPHDVGLACASHPDAWAPSIVISAGYAVCCLLVVPLGFWNLDDNVSVQVGAFVLTILCWAIWVVAYFATGPMLAQSTLAFCNVWTMDILSLLLSQRRVWWDCCQQLYLKVCWCNDVQGTNPMANLLTFIAMVQGSNAHPLPTL